MRLSVERARLEVALKNRATDPEAQQTIDSALAVSGEIATNLLQVTSRQKAELARAMLARADAYEPEPLDAIRALYDVLDVEGNIRIHRQLVQQLLDAAEEPDA
jgi:hypothetical protein